MVLLPSVLAEAPLVIPNWAWAAFLGFVGLMLALEFVQPGAGDGRAQAILGRLRASTPLLQQVEMRTAGARSVHVNGVNTTVGGAGSFLMVTYLLFNGPQLSEDCTR